MSNMSANVKANPYGIAVICGTALLILLYAFGIPGLIFGGNGPMVDMKELLSASIHAARLGGDKVKEIHEKAQLNEQVKGQTKEGANELKTNGDMASHRKMYLGLTEAFPDVTVVSEEHGQTDDSIPVTKLDLNLADVSKIVGDQVYAKDLTVWIDPLDATQEYTENLGQYVTTMVCVAVKGKPVIGVIHRPFKGETVWAYVGHGTSDNLHLVKDVKHGEGEGYSIIVSRSHSGSVEPIAKKSFGDNTKVIPAGGAGYKTLEVIEGRADAYVHSTAIKKWDICAGNAILLAVNGKQTTLTNKEIDYSAVGSHVNSEGLLATTSNHEKYLSALAPIFDESSKRSKRDTGQNAENYRVAYRE